MLATTVCYSQSVLEITFNSLKSGKAILINTNTLDKDTLAFNNGFLAYNGKLEGPALFSLIISEYNKNSPIYLILSNEKTQVEFKSFKKSEESQNINEVYPNTPHFLKDPNNNRIFYNFIGSWKKFYNTIQQLSTDNSEGLLEKRKATYHSFLNTCDSLIQANNNQFVSAVIIDFLLNNGLLQLETIQSFYDYLAPSVKDSFFGLKIGEYAGKAGRLRPGHSAPDFESVDLDNQKYNLSKLQGKKVLLHFWSSSCAPCIKVAPELTSLAENNKDNLVTINISLDTAKDKWVKGINRAGIGRMRNVCDFTGIQGKVAQDYAINVVPSYYLIDQKAKIIIKGSLNQVSEKIRKSMP